MHVNGMVSRGENRMILIQSNLQNYDLYILFYWFKWRWMIRDSPINYGMNHSFYNMQMILPRTTADG